MSGCWIRSTAQILYRGLPDLGTLIAYCTRARRCSHDAQPLSASAFPATAARPVPGAIGRAETGSAAVRIPERGDRVHDQPLLMNAADRAAFGRVEEAGGYALWRRLLFLLHARRWPSRSRVETN